MYDLELRWDWPCAINTQTREHVLLMRIVPAHAEDSLPLRVAIAVDTSASMRNAGKLDAAREACSTIIRMLRSQDRLSLASFSSGMEVLARTVSGCSEVESAMHELNQIQAAGKTRTDLALDWIDNSLQTDDGALCVGFVITDGHPTDRFGKKISDLSPLVDQAGKIAKKGVVIYTVGMGDASMFNQEFLVDVGDKGKGCFLFAEETSHLLDQLRTRFAMTQSMGTSDATVSIRSCIEKLRVLHCCRLRPDYAPLPVEDSVESTIRVDIGAMRADAQTDVLLRVEPPALGFGESLGERNIVEVSLTIGSNTVASRTASLRYTGSYREAQTQNAEVNFARQMWDIKRLNDELIRVSDPVRTGELLENIWDMARKTGVLDVADGASQALSDLKKTGWLEANLKTRMTTSIRNK